MLYCVVDSNPYQLSCPGSSVGRALAECRGFESHLGQLFIFPWKKRGVVDLFVVPMPFYLIVFTCNNCSWKEKCSWRRDQVFLLVRCL